MTSALIAYFSLGGTTAKVAAAIAAGLQSEGLRVDLQDVRENPTIDIDSYAVIGIGSPTYYFRPPFNILDFIAALPDLQQLPAFQFVLHGTYIGGASNILHQALMEKGARHIGSFTCRGADYFLGYLKQGFLFSPDHPTHDELEEAQIFGREVVRRLSRPAGIPYQAHPSLGLIYQLERFMTNRFFTEQMLSRFFQVDPDACTSCGLCVEGCPTTNIHLGQDGVPVWGRDCLLCLNCEASCPEDAISSLVTSRMMRPFMRYNVNHAAADPDHEYVHVEHRNGMTQRK